MNEEAKRKAPNIQHLTDGGVCHLVGKCVGNSLELCSRPIPVLDGEAQTCVCPYCRCDIAINISQPKASGPRRPNRSAPVLCEREYAYVALLYGGHPAYFIGALVTGWSLEQHSSIEKQDRIILCTDDVPEMYRNILSECWTIRRVEYITKAPPKCYWDYGKSRFKEVFTKLRIFSVFAGEYKKLVLMDLDLLIRGEMDSLFKLSAPAAMVRGQGYIKHGDSVPVDYFYSGHRQVLGINCGVMLIEPNAKLFRQMEDEIKDYAHVEHWPTHGPEQDYLSRFFNAFGVWTNISCRYNYQVHLTQFGSPEWNHLNTVGHKKVSVYHYSGRLVRPWDILLDLLIAHEMEYEAIIEFVKYKIPRIAAETHAYRLRNEPHPTLTRMVHTDDTSFSPSKFCCGNNPSVHCSQKCFLHRYIHASWSEADSEAVVEWIQAFRKADESMNHSVTHLLRNMYVNESTRTDESCKPNSEQGSGQNYSDIDDIDT